MNLKGRWLQTGMGGEGSLARKKNIIFALLFLVPVASFLFFAAMYDVLGERSLLYFFVVLLAAALVGFVVLRSVFNRVSEMSRELRDRAPLESRAGERRDSDEVETIAESFAAMERRISSARALLERKNRETAILKELSDLCYVTLDEDELLHIMLERALKMADADIGSVMMLDGPERNHFTVRATVGLADHVSIGDKVEFASSLAKYAVINKSPLVIEDIETDSRFGRVNRPQYGTKSFICLPIKTMREIIGVVTVSRRRESPPFTVEQAEIIAPLVSNAAFTFENLRLLREREGDIRLSQVLDRICDTLGTSFGERERIRAILGELRKETGFRRAVILLRLEDRPEELAIHEYHEPGEAGGAYIKPGERFSASYHLFERVLRRGDSLVVEDFTRIAPSSERDLIVAGDDEEDLSLLIPMKNDGVVMGILLLCGMKQDSFATCRRLLEEAASILTLVVVKGSLSEAVARRAGELASLRQIGGALASSTFDMNQVLSYTMDMIKSTMHVEAGSLLLVKEGALEFSVAFGMDIGELRQKKLKQGEGIAGYVASRGETVVVNDVAASTLFEDDFYETINIRTQSVLAVPLISQGRVIGVLEVINKTIGDFIQDDVQLLQSISSSVSIALENARLYGETLSMAEHEREVRRIFQKFVPKEIVDRIVHGTEADVKLHDEFRTLTLLDIDIRNFSGMAKRVGPQKTVALLNHFFSVMGEIVFNHKGIVDKYLGDGFLALFGAPLSSAADADNALKAALEMREALEVLNERFVEEAGMALVVGISIHTGEVVVGNIGFEKKMDYTVIGDSVNAVFRIQELTKQYANGILVSEMTRRAAQSRFDMREVGKSDIDVAPGETTIYELLSLSAKEPSRGTAMTGKAGKPGD